MTRFEYEAVPVGETLAGALVLPLSAEVVRGVLTLAAEAPEELTTITNIMLTPPVPGIPQEAVGKPSVIITLVYAGDPAEGQRVLEPFRSLATPIAELVAPMPYPGTYQFTAEAGTPQPAVTRSFMAEELDDAAVATIAARMSSPEAPPATITQLRVFGGEMARVSADTTAFAHRSANFLVGIYTTFDAPERIAEQTAWTDSYFAEIRHAGTGAHVNFLDREGEARIREAYPTSTYRRLADAKARWDPDNVFSRNQNVRPS